MVSGFMTHGVFDSRQLGAIGRLGDTARSQRGLGVTATRPNKVLWGLHGCHAGHRMVHRLPLRALVGCTGVHPAGVVDDVALGSSCSALWSDERLESQMA